MATETSANTPSIDGSPATNNTPADHSIDFAAPRPIVKAKGVRRALHTSRNFVRDLLHFSEKQPAHAILKDSNVSAAAEARKAAGQRIGWATMYIKAYAMVAKEQVELRQTYMSLPWGHIYEHPHSIARIAVARKHEGVDWLFFAPIHEPESMSLPELQAEMDRHKHAPIEELIFGVQARFSRLPTFLRRLAWWVTLNLSGSMRINRSGTFGSTTLGGFGCTNVHPARIQTTVLTYGPVQPNGDVRTTLIYDHRLMDGIHVCRALNSLEDTLNGPIAEELRAL